MNAALFRITLSPTTKRQSTLSRRVGTECLDSAVLCAQQWLVWSNAAGRGQRSKYGRYRVEERCEDGAWREVACGTLADARKAWTKEDEARIDAEPMVGPAIDQRGTARTRTAYITRGGTRPKSRLAQLVEKMQLGKK